MQDQFRSVFSACSLFEKKKRFLLEYEFHNNICNKIERKRYIVYRSTRSKISRSSRGIFSLGTDGSFVPKYAKKGACGDRCVLSLTLFVMAVKQLSILCRITSNRCSFNNAESDADGTEVLLVVDEVVGRIA